MVLGLLATHWVAGRTDCRVLATGKVASPLLALSDWYGLVFQPNRRVTMHDKQVFEFAAMLSLLTPAQRIELLAIFRQM